MDDDEAGFVFRLPPNVFLSAGSIGAGCALKAGWGNAGLLWGFFAFAMLALWLPLERYRGARARVAQLEDALTVTRVVAQSGKSAGRRRPPRHRFGFGRPKR